MTLFRCFVITAGKCSFYLADLSDTRLVADVAGRIAKEHGVVDTLVVKSSLGNIIIFPEQWFQPFATLFL
jgi:hypothetical protein